MSARVILKSISWVNMRGHDLTFVCTRCGAEHKCPTPLPVDAMPFFGRGFQECHRYCKALAEQVKR